MKAFYLKNLIAKTASEGFPWEFKITAAISEEIRTNKAKRQEFYSNPDTDHSFYSFVEPVNPTMRVSREENPPYFLHGIPVDYDTLALPAERVVEAIKALPLKPHWVEQSLGRNWRLIFTFPSKICVHDYDFCVFILKRAIKWLNLNILPCCDEGALTTPTRYLCNGGQWQDTGHGDLPAEAVQAFLVECAKAFDFKPVRTDADVPLDVVEKAIREKFPDFQWPSAFELESQGPSFWLPESTSPKSAIVKPGGMVTFSAHAVQTFYPWSHPSLLGAEFSKKWSNDSIAKATENVYWNGHEFYLKGINGLFEASNKDEVMSFLEINCGMSAKPDKTTGKSMLKEALNYIYRQNKIASAGPFAMQKPGIIFRDNARILNTYACRPMTPSAGEHKFGPHGDFPFLSAMYSHMHQYESAQFWHFVAWWQLFYTGALNWDPKPGQNLFLGGIHSAGKTLTNILIGMSVGGSVDASEFVLGRSPFNAHLYEKPHWRIDDETIIGSPANSHRAATMFKKVAANQTHMSHAKFQKQSMVDFLSRLGVTFNLDTNSMRIIGPQDAATLEKTMIFRCNDEPFAGFVSRDYVAQKIREELPHFLAWLLTVKIPDCVRPHHRYGWAAYHDDMLLDRTNQSQTIAPFKEILIECLYKFKRENPQAAVLRGTNTQLMRLLAQNPLNDLALRNLTTDRMNHHLEQIQKEGLLKCEAESGKHKTRVWIFPLDDFIDTEPATEPMVQTETTNTKNPFEK